MMETSTLEITIIGARGVRNADGGMSGRSDCFCTCEVLENPHSKFHTPTINNTLDPTWNHVQSIQGFRSNDALLFEVFDSDTFSSTSLGQVVLGAQDFFPYGIEGELILQGEKATGGLTVKVIVLPDEGQGGPAQGMIDEQYVAGMEQMQVPMTLQVTLEGAMNLYDADGGLFSGKSDPYAICMIAGNPNSMIQTHTVKDELNPVWSYQGEIHGFTGGDTLEFQVFDNDLGADALLGKAMLSAADILPYGVEGELPLAESRGQVEATLMIKVHVQASIPEEGQQQIQDGMMQQQDGMMQQQDVMMQQQEVMMQQQDGMMQQQDGMIIQEAEIDPAAQFGPTKANLQVTIVSAEGLYQSDGWLTGKSDPYVICEVPGKPKQKIQTPVINNTLNPTWNHTDVIRNYTMGDGLEFQVWDSDFGKDQLLGKFTLSHADFSPNGCEGAAQLEGSPHATGTLSILITVQPADEEDAAAAPEDGVVVAQNTMPPEITAAPVAASTMPAPAAPVYTTMGAANAAVMPGQTAPMPAQTGTPQIGQAYGGGVLVAVNYQPVQYRPSNMPSQQASYMTPQMTAAAPPGAVMAAAGPVPQPMPASAGPLGGSLTLPPPGAMPVVRPATSAMPQAIPQAPQTYAAPPGQPVMPPASGLQLPAVAAAAPVYAQQPAVRPTPSPSVPQMQQVQVKASALPPMAAQQSFSAMYPPAAKFAQAPPQPVSQPQPQPQMPQPSGQPTYRPYMAAPQLSPAAAAPRMSPAAPGMPQYMPQPAAVPTIQGPPMPQGVARPAPAMPQVQYVQQPMQGAAPPKALAAQVQNMLNSVAMNPDGTVNREEFLKIFGKR